MGWGGFKAKLGLASELKSNWNWWARRSNKEINESSNLNEPQSQEYGR
jgi:hypothetical protein